MASPGNWERYRAEWEPRAQRVAHAAKADDASRQQLREQLFASMAATNSWRNLAAALDQVLDGARVAEALADAHDLDRLDYLILTKVLEAIAAPSAAVVEP